MGVLVTTVYRGRTQPFEIDTRVMPSLDVADDETFERWCAAPEHDTRTLGEFAAAGGARVAPPDGGYVFELSREDRRALRDELPPVLPLDVVG